jgi:hypothetical protein
MWQNVVGFRDTAPTQHGSTPLHFTSKLRIYTEQDFVTGIRTSMKRNGKANNWPRRSSKNAEKKECRQGFTNRCRFQIKARDGSLMDETSVAAHLLRIKDDNGAPLSPQMIKVGVTSQTKSSQTKFPNKVSTQSSQTKSSQTTFPNKKVCFQPSVSNKRVSPSLVWLPVVCRSGCGYARQTALP